MQKKKKKKKKQGKGKPKTILLKKKTATDVGFEMIDQRCTKTVVTLQANFTKINTPSLFFMFF